MKNKKIKYAQNGITLIALVITIIILLILVGVVLNLTLGEHGIIKLSEESRKNYINSADEEQRKLSELLNETDNIINRVDKGSEPVRQPTTVRVGGTTHTAKPIDYTWKELSELAKIISDNYGIGEGQINNNTAEVNVSINGKFGTLGIGDWTTVNGKQVRILGFNHDALTDEAIYGGTNTYAGISFEFSEIIENVAMNSSDTNANGWEACELRETLNSITYNSLENKEYIKQVNKAYIKTYNNAGSVTTVADKLWLLSCSEIWNNGREGKPYGLAVAKEGEQYKYYRNINANASSNNPNIEMKNGWLRSPYKDFNTYFCTTATDGMCSTTYASSSLAILPGFSI